MAGIGMRSQSCEEEGKMPARDAPHETQHELQADTQEALLRRKSSRHRRAEEVKLKYDFSVIRTLRQQKGLTIERFAKECGLSYAPISRIETNLIKPNLDTLDRIAEGLGISTYSLVAMAERREVEVQKAKESKVGNLLVRTFVTESMDLHFCEGRKGATSSDASLHTRDIVTVAVRTGTIDLRVHEKVTRLVAGESMTFDCVYPNLYLAVEDCDFVIVQTARR